MKIYFIIIAINFEIFLLFRKNIDRFIISFYYSSFYLYNKFYSLLFFIITETIYNLIIILSIINIKLFGLILILN
jgi:hypothetical protein